MTQIPCRAQEEGGLGAGAKTGTVEVAVGGGSVEISGAVGFERRNGACRCKIPKHYKVRVLTIFCWLNIVLQRLRAPWDVASTLGITGGN